MTDFQEINDIINRFEPIFLEELGAANLQNRVDTKYMIPFVEIQDILLQCEGKFKIFEINKQRLCGYESLYFDTEDLLFYQHHQRQRANRYKVRKRRYLSNNLSFLEVKFKNNKNKTSKKRIETETEEIGILNSKQLDFLDQTVNHEALDLKKQIWVNYNRVTLVNPEKTERITLDFNLNFKNSTDTITLSDIVIAEVKQAKVFDSFFPSLLKKKGIRPGGISKYCLGTISLNKEIKHHTFKPKLRILKKISQQYAQYV